MPSLLHLQFFFFWLTVMPENCRQMVCTRLLGTASSMKSPRPWFLEVQRVLCSFVLSRLNRSTKAVPHILCGLICTSLDQITCSDCSLGPTQRTRTSWPSDRGEVPACWYPPLGVDRRWHCGIKIQNIKSHCLLEIETRDTAEVGAASFFMLCVIVCLLHPGSTLQIIGSAIVTQTGSYGKMTL